MKPVFTYPVNCKAKKPKPLINRFSDQSVNSLQVYPPEEVKINRFTISMAWMERILLIDVFSQRDTLLKDNKPLRDEKAMKVKDNKRQQQQITEGRGDDRRQRHVFPVTDKYGNCIIKLLCLSVNNDGAAAAIQTGPTSLCVRPLTSQQQRQSNRLNNIIKSLVVHQLLWFTD